MRLPTVLLARACAVALLVCPDLALAQSAGAPPAEAGWGPDPAQSEPLEDPLPPGPPRSDAAVTAGVVLIVTGALASVLGTIWVVSSATAAPNTVGYGDILGASTLGGGGAMLAVGIPLVVWGSSEESPAPRRGGVAVGPSGASLLGTF